MLKIEYVWRELLYQAIELENPYFQISALSKKFGLSTSVVAHALKPLKELSIIETAKTRSQIINAEKLLFFYATRRRFGKDIVYQTFSPLALKQREASLPSSTYLTAFSAMRLYYHKTPADYDHVYFYTDEVNEVKNRFVAINKPPNLFALEADPFLFLYPKTPLAQIFADLWNLPEWYARDYWIDLYNNIKDKIGL